MKLMNLKQIMAAALVVGIGMSAWADNTSEVVATAEKKFALVVFSDLPTSPTEDDIRVAIQASGAKDKERILALILGSDDPAAAYQEFRAWAESLGGIAVANSNYAGDSYAFGVTELFSNVPEVLFTDIAVSANEPGTMDVAVTVKDGEASKPVSSEKVAEMFEATTNAADWTETARVEPHVTDRTKAVATPVAFMVKPGDGTSDKAFLRIKK